MNSYMKILRLVFAVVFASAFVWLIFNFCLSQVRISEDENRTLANMPVILQNGKWNYFIGRQFEDFLKDHFPARQKFIRTKFDLIYKLNNKVENIKSFYGDDGWMFDKKETLYVQSLKKQKKHAVLLSKTLKQIYERFEEKNMLIYVAIIPDREDLYKKYWEKHYPAKELVDYEKELMEALQDYPNFKFIPLKDKFFKLAKKEMIFYKDDVHLTPYAQSVITKEVFKRLQEDGLLKDDVVLKENLSNEPHEHVASISANLGRDGKAITDLPILSLSLDKLHSTITEELDYKVLTDNGYKGKVESPIISAQNPNAPIDKLGIFLGSCDTEEAYDVLNPLFTKSLKIRPNVAEMGGDAVFAVYQKFWDISFEKDAAIMIMIIPPDAIYFIRRNILMK